MNLEVDVAVVGSGFAGSILSMIARRHGLSVALIEKRRHPRFVIGESSTPLAGLLMEEIAETYDLPFLRVFSKWGLWQESQPAIRCGLKRGFTFYRHTLGRPFEWRPDHDNEWLFAASPDDRVADVHWYRPDVDACLKDRAVELGVEYFERCDLEWMTWEGERTRLEGVQQGRRVSFCPRLVLDASGPRGFIFNQVELGDLPMPHLPVTRSVFTHFRGVASFCGHSPYGDVPPYPPESAAVHHVFPGGWFWILHFNNGITSAGVVLDHRHPVAVEERGPEALFKAALQELPSLERTFRFAEAVEPFHELAQTSFRSSQITGPGWAMIPSTAGFLDPMLSTGFPLTLLGVQRLGRLLPWLDQPERLQAGLGRYAEQTTMELMATERLLAALYWNFDRFDVFKEITRLYFAAASYSEVMRRLGRSEEVGSFLLLDHPTVGPGIRACLDEAIRMGQSEGKTGATPFLRERIDRTIEPIDVAGLTDPERGNYRSVDLTDLFNNRHKLNAGADEIARMLERSGLSVPAGMAGC